MTLIQLTALSWCLVPCAASLSEHARTRPLQASSLPEAERPPVLAPQPGCEIWRGTSTGNDPSVVLEVRLCESPSGITGQTQWSSTTSGWSLRELAGLRTDDDRYVLRDIAMLDQRPEPDWRFCLIEEYELIPTGNDRLAGTYISEACNDSAVLDLKRVPSPPALSSDDAPSSSAAPSGAATPSQGETSSAADRRSTEPDKRPGAPVQLRGCACATVTAPDPDRSKLAWLGLALALSLARLRYPRRWTPSTPPTGDDQRTSRFTLAMSVRETRSLPRWSVIRIAP